MSSAAIALSANTNSTIEITSSSVDENPGSIFTREGFNESLAWFEVALTRFVIRLGIAIVLFIIGVILIRIFIFLLKRFLLRKSKARTNVTLINFGLRALSVVLRLLLFVACVDVLQISIISISAMLAAFAFAVGLAVSGFLNSVLAGAYLASAQPLRVDEYVSVCGIEGTVLAVEPLNTVIRTPDFRRAVLPNQNVATSNIINYSREERRRVECDVLVHAHEDLVFVRRALLAVAYRDERVLSDPEPHVRVMGLADATSREHGVGLSLRAWVLTAVYWDVFFEFRHAVKAEFDRVGVRLAGVQRDTHVVKYDDDDVPRNRPECDKKYREAMEHDLLSELKEAQLARNTSTGPDDKSKSTIMNFKWIRKLAHMNAGSHMPSKKGSSLSGGKFVSARGDVQSVGAEGGAAESDDNKRCKSEGDADDVDLASGEGDEDGADLEMGGSQNSIAMKKRKKKRS